MMRDAWQTIVNCLEKENVEYVFGLPGSASMFFDALYDSDKITTILPREQVDGAFMAAAYSQANGKHGVCYGGPGPGFTNLLSGILEANATCTPLIVISGSASTNITGNPAFQEVPQLEMAKQITKWAIRITDPERVTWAMQRAFSISKSGKPGPVYIEIPGNIGKQKCEVKKYNTSDCYYKHKPEKSKLYQALNLLKESKKPLLICGGGTNISQAYNEVNILMNEYNIPVMTSNSGRGIVKEDNLLALGLTGLYFTELGRGIYNDSDLLITVGTKNEQFETGDWEMLPDKAKYIHIDIDPNQFNRNIITDIQIAGDAKLVLEDLIKVLEKELDNKTLSIWKKRSEKIKKLKIEETEKIEKEYNNEFKKENSNYIKSKWVVYNLNKVFGDNTVLVNENGSQDLWSYYADYYKILNEGDSITPGNQTCMGFGVSGAIGVKLAKPEKNVVCVTGDGAFQMHMRELPTAVQYNAPITYIVLDNEELGWIKFGQKINNKRYIASEFKAQPDFAKIASACNCYGENIKNNSDVIPALKRALKKNKEGIPAVLSFKVDGNSYPQGFLNYYKEVRGYNIPDYISKN